MMIDENKLIMGLIGLITSIFWYWLKSRDKRFEAIEKHLIQIEHDYQHKEYAQRDFNLIHEMLKDIQAQVHALNTKIDRKVDK